MKGKKEVASDMIGKPFSPMGTNQEKAIFNANYPAPEFVGIAKWLNTDKPLTLKELRGKVVLVDIWTYTCINCIRTLPYLTRWYEKYKDQGFVVIGVHSPEFEFEKKTENVLSAMKRYNITYPVAQDNDFATWNAYNNQYWPAKYLIDTKGNVRYTHFGEGKYEETEKAIQLLLKEAGQIITSDTLRISNQTPTQKRTQEIYLGSSRMEYFDPHGSVSNGTQTFQLPKSIRQNTFSLGGQWTISDDYSRSEKNSVLILNFIANKVFLVMRPQENQSGIIKVLLDGKIIDMKSAGSDVKNGTVTLDADREYNIIDLKGTSANHVLRLEFQNSGIETFAFTFG